MFLLHGLESILFIVPHPQIIIQLCAAPAFLRALHHVLNSGPCQSYSMLDPVHDVKTDVGVLIINSILDINGPHTRISILLLFCTICSHALRQPYALAAQC